MLLFLQGMQEGIVYRSTGSWYSVKAGSKFYQCRIKGKIRLQGIKSTNPVAVGDRIHFEPDPKQPEQGVIHEILDRKNYIIRRSVNLSKQTHIIAANIDQAFLLVTVNNPVTTYTFIDRFLAAAAAYRIPVVLLFNKIDSYSNEEQQTLEKMQAIYTAIGYETHFISALEKEGIGDLKQAMNGKVSMFSGHSGVGKSTLANAISPELQLKTASVSTAHAQGQHTTTFAEMFDLDSGIRIIDTPGIRGFGVVDMSPTELADYFLEFLSLQESCKFHNCLHVEEPDCAIKAAVENGAIATSRYTSYLQLLEEDTPYRK
ncbi:MAG: Small ribosomal subunit biogenesis GTPase RsgA [Flavobacteriaceae bacterium]|nr:MAG: Small ribosomal subunit biogenesis GTPase RsgA [Flavobacteriaceae bacterium]|tara:strand:- start:274 stop:1221 length:948 start_codon:yes stop_codon:yes gene_type:complete